MTTTAVTPEQHLTLLKHLAGGKTLDVVAAIMNLDRSAVLDAASKHGYPDRDKLAWAVDVLAKKNDDDSTSAIPAATQLPAHARPRPAAVAAAPVQTTSPLTKPDEIRVLLNTAKSHPAKRIQSAADKIFDSLDRLRALLAEDEERNSDRRKAEAAKVQARAEVDRLEAQLKAAKAKLRGRSTDTTARPPAPTRPRPVGVDLPCRNEGCDKSYDTPQGRSLHERMKCEHRQSSAAAS